MPNLKLFQLEADPKNPNVCSPDTLAKLKVNIQRTGYYDYPIVRPHPDRADTYIIIDGHARVQIFQELGWTEIFCQIWEISEEDAKLALATLNRLRGEDIPKKRAELIAELAETIPLDTLADLIPETGTQIQDLLALLEQDAAAMEKALKAEMEREAASLPVPLTFLLEPADHAIWESTHAAFAKGLKDRGKVLIHICQTVMKEQIQDEQA